MSNDGIHLTLHKVDGPSSSQPLINILTRDEGRIRALNSRLTKTTVTPSSRSHDPRRKAVSIPVQPGASLNTGSYYINLGFGTPAKSYALTIDTGSALTWLQCQPCQVQCHSQVGPPFDPTASTTYKFISCDAAECSGLDAATQNPSSCTKNNVCIYTATYGDGSISKGHLSRDTLTIAPTEILPGFIYGCGQDTHGVFGKEAGLVGLSRNNLSMLGQLSSKYGYVFSYCLPTDSSNGTLSIGPSSDDPTTYKFTPMLADPQGSGLYFLELTGITVGSKLLNVSAEKYKTSTIIDSGAVITRLPLTVYTALRAVFVEAMSKYESTPKYLSFDTCFNGSSGGISVPEVTLMFQGGADLKLGAQNIVLEGRPGEFCLAFISNKDDTEIAIIGSLQQETFTVAYDVTNSKIGFAADGCK
ncbi:Peptidase A1 [Macleaya cordata]|uniref:Peptidase A1 n=1 Tax=Macleaya cordata TaxID=56857 RepID=A0A200QG33_MACCD|nr:Peptidase A1 [Macleaya cordata]